MASPSEAAVLEPTAAPGLAPALEVIGVTKVYGGEVALSGASMQVQPGEIHGLLGANGAGKSTLVRIVSGVEQQDGGTVSIGGVQLPVPHDAATAHRHGLAHIHQDRALVGELSVAENMALTMGFPRGRGPFIDQRRMRVRAREALAKVGLQVDCDQLVSDLPVADQTLVAIARALAVDASLILLDEPTANLGAQDSAMLYERLRSLASGGVACVLITHALSEALQVCDRVTVLRDGAVVASRLSKDLGEEELAALVVGHKVQQRRRAHRDHGEREVVLSLEDVRCDRLGPLSLEVRSGEIVGLTGLADSGHLLVGEMLGGARRLDGGVMRLGGKRYAPATPADASAHRVACVPPDRLRDGLALQMTARENIFFDGRGVGGPLGIPSRAERSAAGEIMRRASVRPPHSEAVISTLSGGNMQKVLMAKWLATDPRLLVLCEPTVGVDIGAREDIYARFEEATERGLAILLASSDFAEVSLVSDRVFVIRYGAVVAETPAHAASIERLTALSSGGEAVGT